MKKRAVIFDFNRTLYDPEVDSLYPGAAQLLDSQSRSRTLFLYSRDEGGRDTLLEELGVMDAFSRIYFVSNKNAESVRKILTENDLSSEECIVVGDLMTSELAAGNEAGLETVWVKQGRFADVTSNFEPTYVVTSISELSTLLDRIP